MRGFDWILYAALLAGVFWVLTTGQESLDSAAPSASSSIFVEDAELLPPPTAGDPQLSVELADVVATSSGTAFSVNDGVWLTARHVVDGCPKVALLIQANQGVLVRDVRPSRNADLAVLVAPIQRRPLALDLDPSDFALQSRGYHIGYPQGKPGEVSSILMGRGVLNVRGRYATREPVIVWAETMRTQGLDGSLGGLSGGPAFDDQGEVVGVIVAEAPRRGRIYTAAPRSIVRAFDTAEVAPADGALAVGPVSDLDFGQRGRELRRSLQVAKVMCIV